MLWQTLAKQATSTEVEIGTALLNEYLAKGYVSRTCVAMLQVPDRAIAVFYNALVQQAPPRHESGWMLKADFCFINVRATGFGTQFGTFIQAAKLLPALRANAIHLAPFTRYEFGVVYAVSSFFSIAEQLIDHALGEMGFPVAAQLGAFVDAAHHLGKYVGMDIEPHVTQFGVPVLMRPELFRWIKLYEPDKRWLDYLQSQEEMLHLENQRYIVQQVREIVQQGLEDHNLIDLEIYPSDRTDFILRKKHVYAQLVRTLIDKGFWTIPSQIWSGVGVPAFKSYNYVGNYPEFEYRNRKGEIDEAAALRIVTPFKFYDGLPVNRLPDQNPTLNQKALDYFSHIFAYWRDEFGFDFARYDSADHIFDSTLNHDAHYLPASDRPTPFVFEECIKQSKAPNQTYVGNLAERMGNEIELYGEIGFDLVLGSDMLEPVDAAHLEKCFDLYDRLSSLNCPGSILYAVDTHDTGDPNLGKEPLIKREGSQGMLQRQFIGRFINCGAARRPKYEVMGVQDLSYGLHEANVREQNLTWVGNETHNQHYHQLEDLYEQRYREFMQGAVIQQRKVTQLYAWWRLQNGERWVIAVVSFAKTTKEIKIPLGKAQTFKQLDLTSQETMLQGEIIEIKKLPPRAFMLFEGTVSDAL